MRNDNPIRYVSKERNEDCMNHLLITENENKHYVLIKDFNKFMYNQTKHKERKHFCMYCLQCFSSEQVLNNHKEICVQVKGTQAIKMPDKSNNIFKFNNFHKQQPVPFVVYADFEAYQKHTDCGYGYKVICCYDDKHSKPVQIYRGEKMLNEVKYCKTVMKRSISTNH